MFTFPIVPRKRLVGQGIGEYPGQHKGQGHEFIEKREYRSSDSMRIVDWKETAKRSGAGLSFLPYVREFRRDEIMRGVIVVDRSPRMALYPRPWLNKASVIVNAGQMIVDSLVKCHALVGYLDFADWDVDNFPFWRPPNKETEASRVRNRNLAYHRFTAPDNNLDMALEWLLFVSKRQVPPESFIFLMSDFLLLPRKDLIEEVVAMWDLVPIIIQDPTLEMSFPLWSHSLSVWLPMINLGERRSAIYVTGKDALKLKAKHQARLQEVINLFEEVNVQPVVLSFDSKELIYDAFIYWNELRMRRDKK